MKGRSWTEGAEKKPAAKNWTEGIIQKELDGRRWTEGATAKAERISWTAGPGPAASASNGHKLGKSETGRSWTEGSGKRNVNGRSWTGS